MKARSAILLLTPEFWLLDSGFLPVRQFFDFSIAGIANQGYNSASLWPGTHQAFLLSH
jgi:hypothetical protein